MKPVMRVDKNHRLGLQVLKTLNEAGYEAFFVGGFVRDYLLGLSTEDIDITTNARPEEIEALFSRVKATGRAFGTMTVLVDKVPFEITTYRRETVYDNHRHPNSIRYSDTLEEDLARRDFTINQLVMDQDGNIHDHHGGKEDLSLKRIRTIGAPDERLTEDALRMLRAFRFAGKLDFTIEERTLEAIERHARLIRRISIERVQEELFKLFDAPYKKHAIRSMVAAGFHKALRLANGLSILKDVDIEYGPLEAFAVFEAEDGLDEEVWHLSNRYKKHIRTVMDLLPLKRITPKLLFDHGEAVLESVNIVHRMLGGDDKASTIRSIARGLVIEDRRELALGGKDIRALPIGKPSHIKETLELLIERVLDGEVDNEYQALRREAMHIIEQLKERDHG